MSKGVRRSVAAALLLGVGVVRSPGQAALTGLGALAGEEAERVVTAVSADGLTVVGIDTTEQVVEGAEGPFGLEVDRGFRWTQAGGLSHLPLPEDALGTTVTGVSGDGSVIVGNVIRVVPEWLVPVEQPFRWTAAGGYTMLPMPDGAFDSKALGVSSDGTFVFGYMDSEDGIQAFRWSDAGGLQGLGFFPDGIESRALGASADGSVIVGFANHADGIRAFRWTSAGGMQNLGILPDGLASRAAGVSADGLVVVGAVEFEDDIEKAFRWTADGGLQNIALDGMEESVAMSASADGGIIVGQMVDDDDGEFAFVWDATHGMRSLREILTAAGVEIADWDLVAAVGVSADGTVVAGLGYNADDATEPWRAVLPAP